MLVDGIRLVNASIIDIGVVEAGKQGATLPATGTVGDEYELTVVYNGKQPGVYMWHGSEWVIKSPDRSATPYDISCGSMGMLGAAAVLTRLAVPRAFGIKGAFFGSIAFAGQGPAANVALQIRRIDRQGTDVKLGEIQYTVGDTVGLFVQDGSDDMRFAPGEVMYIKGPDVADTTLSDLSITIAGYLI